MTYQTREKGDGRCPACGCMYEYHKKRTRNGHDVYQCPIVTGQ